MKAEHMAAKRKKKASVSPWLIATLAVGILAIAAVALLSDDRLSIPSAEGSGPPPGVSAGQGKGQHYDHDRDQIDQSSRDQLRDILRSAGDSENGS